MREEIIKVYSFDELSEESKEVAIEKYRTSIEWSFESEYISEDFKEILSEKHLPNEDVEWSLSNCQGDGVAFYGDIDNEDTYKIAKEFLNGESLELLEKIYNENLTIECRLYRNAFGHRYSHWNTMAVQMNHDNIDTIVEYIYNIEDYDSKDYEVAYDKVSNLIDEVEHCISQYIKDVSRELEKIGYDQIEYVESDEGIIETIKANDYEFTEDGNMY